MIYECCSRDKIRFELESWYENMSKEEVIIAKITKYTFLKDTYNLEVTTKDANCTKDDGGSE